MSHDDGGEVPGCPAARESLSCILDHEAQQDSGLADTQLVQHLVDCPACRRWYADATRLQRHTRVALAPDLPDLTDRILPAPDRSRPGGSRLRGLLRRFRPLPRARGTRPPGARPEPMLRTAARWALLLIGLAQLWVAFPVLWFARDPEAGVHGAHELGAFDTALAVGFLYVARRPRAAFAMRWLVGVLTALLLGGAAVDLAHGGRTTLTEEAPHLLSLAGFVALLLLSRARGDSEGAPIALSRHGHGRPRRVGGRGPVRHSAPRPGGLALAGVDEWTACALAAAGGDADAQRAFVRATQSDVWRLCAHLGDLEAADDLTQEVYLRVFRSLPGYRGEAPVRSWLFRIVRRVVADDIATRQRHRRSTRSQQHSHLVGHRAPQQADHSGQVVLDQLLRELEPERRAAFVLTQVLGYPYATAAEMCQCPVGTIRSRVARARSDLIAMMSADDRTGASGGAGSGEPAAPGSVNSASA